MTRAQLDAAAALTVANARALDARTCDRCGGEIPCGEPFRRDFRPFRRTCVRCLETAAMGLAFVEANRGRR